jgi:hypothetical protein
VFDSDQMVAIPLVRGDVLDLLRRPVLEQELEGALEALAGIRERTGANRRPVERKHERRGGVERVDPKDLARLELQRVVDDEVGEAGDASVGHVCLIPD